LGFVPSAFFVCVPGMARGAHTKEATSSDVASFVDPLPCLFPVPKLNSTHGNDSVYRP